MLYKFQKQLVNSADPNFLYAADTGTGKTIMAIHHYLKHSNGEPILLIAPPQKLKEGGWRRDIQAVCDFYKIEIQFSEMSYGKLADLYKMYKGWFVIFDEAHYIKNPTSQRGKAAVKLAKQSSHFVMLTATPASNGWEDTYNYFIMFGYFKSKKEMNDRYAKWGTMYLGNRRIPKIEGWINEDQLHDKYHSFTVSISKDEALDLPPLIFKDVNFTRSSDYDKVVKQRVLGAEEFDTPSKLAHGLRYYANQKDKLDYAEMICEGTENNIVIFYYYQKEIDALKKKIKNKQFFEVSGKDSHLPSKSSWSELKNSVTFVQYMAGSAGIELQYANIVIFYTPTYSYQDYSQALGRAYRNGQTKKVTVYRFITQRTIEQAVYEALENKQDFSEELYMSTKLQKNTTD
ncbi:SNF2-related protein [Enterococcus hirae]|uniref:SNF2-related protein n=1 Tax=Enterococcus faecium TaxID=1352 RepID=UPI0003541907|nr:DEAD/DEAH box helicase [Enterococcus faecium]EPI08446.1 protein, SNF2 family [Enterococcus faecium SD3B-2]MDP8000727.1 DEAD/DEAH box helicase [Enterococcus faecium]